MTVDDLPTAEALAAAIRAEVEEMLAAGTLPATVASFSALHDYCDANMLGQGAESLIGAPPEDSQVLWNAFIDRLNDAQGIVHDWMACRAAFAEAGWTEEGMGGGCVAYSIARPEWRDCYSLITDDSGNGIPEALGAPVVLGFYDPEGEALATIDCLTAAEALRIAPNVTLAF